MAQSGTEIYLAPLEGTGSSLAVGTPANVTRRPGYDNQPSFAARGRAIWFTARHGDQTDIYQHDLASGSTTRLTRTAESEYSPTLLPDETGFSVIRVERDSTQRLWRFALDGTNPELVLEYIRPVGYHAWAGPQELVLFVLGDPPTLQRVRAQATDTLAQNPGRSIHRVPGEAAVSFVHKKSADEWWIRRLHLATGTITDIVRTLPGSEDHAWTPDGVLMMAQGPALYAWSPASGPGWREVRRFSEPGLQHITRLAVSPDGTRLAFVSDEPE